MNETCPGCSVELEKIEGPTDPYKGSSPSCWKVYGEVLAKEFSDPQYYKAHRLSVDAYMAQHPSKLSRAAIQSVQVHLFGLYLTLEKNLTPRLIGSKIAQLIKRKKHSFEWLEPPQKRGNITVINLLDATTSEEHFKSVQAWAKSVWKAWEIHHNIIQKFAEEIEIH